LKEAGVDLPADASASASGKPSEVALPDVDNLDLVNMPATFDYEGDETSWHQGLPPGEVGPQLSELELSGSDSSVGSILGACLDRFDGDAWMSEAEGAQDDIQVGAAAGVNDPGDIPWRMTGGPMGDVLDDDNEGEGGPQGGSSVGGDGAVGGGVTLTKEEKRKWKNRTKKPSPSTKKTHDAKTVATMDTPVIHEDLPRTHTHMVSSILCGGQNIKELFLESLIFLSASC